MKTLETAYSFSHESWRNMFPSLWRKSIALQCSSYYDLFSLFLPFWLWFFCYLFLFLALFFLFIYPLSSLFLYFWNWFWFHCLPDAVILCLCACIRLLCFTCDNKDIAALHPCLRAWYSPKAQRQGRLRVALAFQLCFPHHPLPLNFFLTTTFLLQSFLHHSSRHSFLTILFFLHLHGRKSLGTGRVLRQTSPRTSAPARTHMSWQRTTHTWSPPPPTSWIPSTTCFSPTQSVNNLLRWA